MVRGSSLRRATRPGVLVPVALALILVLAGCSGGGGQAPKPPAGTTAKADLGVAKSSLSTMAPDAKLLLIQTAQAVSSTGTPIWGYLFGSPSSDKTFVVYVTNGRSMGAREYGAAGLGKNEWASVPGTDALKIDSDEALRKAIDTSPVKTPGLYEMGLVTYIPKSQAASATTKPFTWYVTLQSGATTASVEVDAKTGAAAVRSGR